MDVAIIVNLDVMLAKRKMSMNELSEKGKAIRFSTLEALCETLECQPGDLLEYVKEE